jgi:peroxiredoxin
VVQLHRGRNRIEESGARVYVVTFDVLWRAMDLVKSGEIPFPLLWDLHREVYSAYELERSFRRSLHHRTVRYYLKNMLRGRGFSKITADPTQLGGDFIVDRGGVIRYAYYSEEPTDHPSVDDIVNELKKIK